mmetsp:Transcript_38154/g.110165  ORF Transcript_38154/g.110165 Transcript_38154/m.110165 type:complete len:83 (-) Transcript_38154:871-1119(-)
MRSPGIDSALGTFFVSERGGADADAATGLDVAELGLGASEGRAARPLESTPFFAPLPVDTAADGALEGGGRGAVDAVAAACR